MTTTLPKFGLKPQYPNGLKGFLVKRGHVMKNWKQRYFVLANSEIKYYTDDSCTQLQGGYHLNNVSFLNCTEMEGRKWVIVVEAEKFETRKIETLAISAANSEERDNWLMALEEVIHGGPSVEMKGVWSQFHATLTLNVTYPKLVQVDDGNEILPSAASAQPSVNFIGTKDLPSDVYHTLIMVNPDHCVKGDLNNRGMYLHWLVLNIPSNSISKGNEVIKYQGPAPFKGSNANRYVFLLFRQSGGPYSNAVLSNTSDIMRDNFNLTRWTLYLNLTNPVGINGFYSTYERGYCEEALHSHLGMIAKPVSGAAVSTPPAIEPKNGHTSRSGSFTSANGTASPTNSSSSSGATSPNTARRSSGAFVDESQLDKQVEQLVLTGAAAPLAVVVPPKELDAEARLDAMMEDLIKANPEVPSALKKYPRMPGTPKKVVTFLICNPALMSDPQPVTSSFYEDGEEEVGEGGSPYDDGFVSDYQVSYDTSSNSGGGNNIVNSPIRISSGLSINTQMIANATAASSASTDSGESSPVVSHFPAAPTPPPPTSPLSRRTSSNGSIDPNSPGVGSNRSLIPLMQRLNGITDTPGFCHVFAISTESVFDGITMRKKFSKDMIMKDSFVWIDPLSKSIHWAKSATEKNVTHKHILLDKNSSYTIIGGSSSNPGSTTQNYRKQAGGTQMGVIKGAELDDLTITIATEDDQRLKIKIPPELPNASLCAKEWFKVIKQLTQDAAR